MLYEFICECGNKLEFNNPIKEGPPKEVWCEKCNNKMTQEFCTNFVLKGDGWAGKDLKKRNYEASREKEKMEAQFSEDARNQRIVNDVTDIRRKGKKATEKLKKDNPQKFKDYQDAMKKGYRAKTKSFKTKG